MLDYLHKLWNKFKIHIIYILIILLLISFLNVSVNKCSNVSNEYKHNIEALNDTIKYYQDKNGNLVATKLAFESDINTLKLLNKTLYDQIDSLKIGHKNVSQIVYVNGSIDNPKKDTIYKVLYDTINRGFNKEFNFNNEYRLLEGNVNYKNDTLGVNINKDIVNFDYTIAIDKNSKIYIKSTNPYVKYNEISGFTLPNERQKHWSLDAFSNFNYSPTDNDRFYDIGVSLGYSLSKFTIGPQVYYEHNLLDKSKHIYIGGFLNFNILEW